MQQLKINIRNLLAILTTLCAFGLMFVLTRFEIPKENKSIFDVLFGVLLSQAVVPIYRHFYPSKKDETKTP